MLMRTTEVSFVSHNLHVNDLISFIFRCSSPRTRPSSTVSLVPLRARHDQFHLVRLITRTWDLVPCSEHPNYIAKVRLQPTVQVLR